MEPNIERRILTDVPIDEIKPHPDNPRIHGHKSISTIEASYKEFGVTSLMEVDENMDLLVGHGRWLTHKKRGDVKIPMVMQILGMPEDKKAAYRAANNSVQEASGWDKEKLQLLVDSIPKYDWNSLGIKLDPTDEVDKAFKKFNDDNCEYPIIPKFSEVYNAVTVICTNETDFVYLSTKFGLGKAKTYFKSEKIGQQRIVMFDKIKEVLAKSDDKQE